MTVTIKPDKLTTREREHQQDCPDIKDRASSVYEQYDASSDGEAFSTENERCDTERRE